MRTILQLIIILFWLVKSVIWTIRNVRESDQNSKTSAIIVAAVLVDIVASVICYHAGFFDELIAYIFNLPTPK